MPVGFTAPMLVYKDLPFRAAGLRMGASEHTAHFTVANCMDRGAFFATSSGTALFRVCLVLDSTLVLTLKELISSSAPTLVLLLVFRSIKTFLRRVS